MILQKTKKLLQKPWATAWILTFLCMLISSFRPLYGDRDNYEIALVANKLFGGVSQDGYIMHLHPFLCRILELFSHIGTTDCFTLISSGMLFTGVWACANTIAEKKEDWHTRLLFEGLLVAVVTLQDLFHDNYTRWAAFLTAAGMVILLELIHQKVCHRKKIILAAFLLGSGMMWRDEAFFVFIPYIAVDVFMVFMSSQRDCRKETLKILGRILALPVLCILVLGITDACVKNSDKYSEAVAYDKARVSVVDYPMKEWEEVREKFSDVSENDYESVRNWFLLDTDEIDEQYLLKISKAGRERRFEISIQAFINMQKQVLIVFRNNQDLLYVGILLLILLVHSLLTDLAWYHKIEILCLYLGTDIIFLYFVYVGRAIDRSFIPAAYALLAFLCMLHLTENCKLKRELYQMVSNSVLWMLFIYFMCIEVKEGKWAVNQSVFSAEKNILEKYEDFCQREDLYIWSISEYSKNITSHFAEQGKLIPQEVLEHHIYSGAWTYGQVYYQEFLKSIDAENPMKAFLEREHTYYVGSDYDRILIYLQEHYDENVTAVQVGELEYLPVWQFSVLE